MLHAVSNTVPNAALLLARADGGSTNPAIPFAGWAITIVLVLVIAQIVLFVGGLISVLISPRYTGGGKFLWVVLIFCLPLLGPLGWFIAGRTAVIRTNTV